MEGSYSVGLFALAPLDVCLVATLGAVALFFKAIKIIFCLALEANVALGDLFGQNRTWTELFLVGRSGSFLVEAQEEETYRAGIVRLKPPISVFLWPFWVSYNSVYYLLCCKDFDSIFGLVPFAFPWLFFFTFLWLCRPRYLSYCQAIIYSNQKLLH